MAATPTAKSIMQTALSELDKAGAMMPPATGQEFLKTIMQWLSPATQQLVGAYLMHPDQYQQERQNFANSFMGMGGPGGAGAPGTPPGSRPNLPPGATPAEPTPVDASAGTPVPPQGAPAGAPVEINIHNKGQSPK